MSQLTAPDGSPLKVLVTGGARGLGAVICRHLHGLGCWVAVSDQADAASLAQELDPMGSTALGLDLDVRNKADFEAALSHLIDRWGTLHALVCNAAITRTTNLFEISPEEFDAVLAVNLRGVFLGNQVIGAYLRDQRFGRIVNMASLAGQNGGAATGAHYAASKGGIVTLTKVFARDLAAHGVTVNAISPGPLDVPLVHEILPPEKLQAVIAGTPVGQLGNPEFVAASVGHLLSPGAASMTGATLDMNGGLYLR